MYPKDKRRNEYGEITEEVKEEIEDKNDVKKDDKKEDKKGDKIENKKEQVKKENLNQDEQSIPSKPNSTSGGAAKKRKKAK